MLRPWRDVTTLKSPCQPEIGKFYDEKVKAKLVFLDLFLQVVLCCNIIPTILRWKSENQVSFSRLFSEVLPKKNILD